MKKVLIGFAIVFLGVFAIDLFIGFLGDRLIQRTASVPYEGQTALFNYSLNGAHEDIVIIGSSEASSAYIPSVISEQLQVMTGKEYSVYNAGGHRQGVAYCYCVTRGLIKRGQTKAIIFDIVSDYLIPRDYNDYTPLLRPFSKVNPYVEDLLQYNDGRKEQLLSHSNMYRFNSEIVKLLLANNSSITDGFDAHEGSLPGNEKKGETIELSDNISEVALYEFEHILKESKENGVQVICTISPKYYRLSYDNNSIVKMLDICKQYAVPVCDFSGIEVFNNPLLFHDKGHLNPSGAEICSKLLTEELSNILDK